MKPPRIVSSFWTISFSGTLDSASSSCPNWRTVPAKHASCNAVPKRPDRLNDDTAPCPVSSRTILGRSSRAGLTTSVAPHFAARFRRNGEGSETITFEAPDAATKAVNRQPIGPAPSTTTESPGRMPSLPSEVGRGRGFAAYTPVDAQAAPGRPAAPGECGDRSRRSRPPAAAPSLQLLPPACSSPSSAPF